MWKGCNDARTSRVVNRALVPGTPLLDLCSPGAGRPYLHQPYQGVYFQNIHGKRCPDFNSIVIYINIVHGYERIIEAIIRQSRELTFAGPHMATRACASTQR